MPGVQPQTLPTQFPCWVKAIYSWGGETKRDLGFVEGDLIECLNAGDGSWWMGRLKRDRRQIGLFPSNFVELVTDNRPVTPVASPVKQQPQYEYSNQRPGSQASYHSNADAYGNRGASPNPYQQQRGISPNPYQQNRGVSPNPYQHNRAVSPNPLQHQQNRAVSPNPYGQQRAVSPNPYAQARGASPNPYAQNRAVSPNPYAQNRAVSPNPYAQARGVSPNPYQQQHMAVSPRAGHNQFRAVSPRLSSGNRAVSPNPYQQNHGYQQAARPTTPNTQMHQRTPVSPNHPISRSGTPNPYQNSMGQGPSPSPFHMPQRAKSPAQFRAVSPSPGRPVTPSGYNQETPPPPPPAHSNNYYQRAASPAPSFHNMNGARSPIPSRGPTPQPSPNRMAHTPSPLRSAMDDVMSSLEEMSVVDSGKKSPIPFSADDYDNHSGSSATAVRSHTSQGFRGDAFGRFGSFDGIEIGANPQRNHGISNFVERMEASLRDQGPSSYYSSTDETFDQIRQLKQQQNMGRPNSVMMTARPDLLQNSDVNPNLNAKRRSVWDIDRRPNLSRQSTLQSNSSSAVFSTTSNSTAATSASIMSGMSAGGFSATSAGSFIRHKQRAAMAIPENAPHPLSHQLAPQQAGPFSALSPMESQMVTNSGIVFHSANVVPQSVPRAQTWGNNVNSGNGLGGLSSMNMGPIKKKGGFFKKILATAKASTATARSMAASPTPESDSGYGTLGMSGIAGGNISIASQSQDWVQVRRDVARSNTISRNERLERQEKQEMMDQFTLRPIDFMEEECEGDEALDGGIVELPADFTSVNMTQVDKAARFIGSLPSGTTPAILANSHICRPHRSDVQRLRAMFTWVAEKLSWERPTGLGNDSPSDNIDYNKDCRRVIQSLKATTEEVAIMFMQMCHSVGIGCEIIRGYLKVPGETAETVDAVPRPNHFWNAVVIDNEWRIIDASLASPTHPKRGLYSSAPNNMADSHYFLMRPLHACFTHIPLNMQQQHLVPPMPHSVLMALPCASPGFFKSGIQLINFDTSLLRVEDLEIVQIDFQVPIDVECVAEVEAKGFAVDADGDIFESGDIVKKGALAQVAWEGPLGNIQKTYRVKAVLPGDEGHGILKIYAGPRGLMHSIKDNPHPVAFSLPIFHTGTNPTYNFVTRHPTPHAQRHDLYIVQPQNLRLAFDNSYVFSIRQHSSTVLTNSEMQAFKGAKLAIQTPTGKIMKIGRRADSLGSEHGQVFEQSIKVSERGPWRGLILADRSARWCVFAEWHCV
ncbi:cytokinesis protein 3 [Orbilia blumenaviensis]|uniref:Cytokinesis protein 3 n=1 Tax=Orbilia blumenaviensis TaxID=1796055 RepID=A0AAV9V4U1_9PEZI